MLIIYCFLIVQVENKVKAKKQAERRLHQMVNIVKQRSEADSQGASKKKRSRGAIQREQKRQKRSAEEGGEGERRSNRAVTAPGKKRQEKADKGTGRRVQETRAIFQKVTKKKKVADDEDKKFEARVSKHHHRSVSNSNDPVGRKGAIAKRWFE